MNISIVGTGYVGLVQGACFADTGNDVICMDIDERRINTLKSGGIPIYEPGLEEIVRQNVHEGRLHFTTSLKEAVESELIFLCLPTPPQEDGSADLQYILGVSEQIAKLATSAKILISKSTVPVGTAEKVKKIVTQHSKQQIDVVSNPEFLKEGSAVEDTLKPDRIIIGSKSERANALLSELYEPFVRTGAPILVMDERSAEMVKYAANAFLAAKISFINEIANLCELAGADVDWVRRGIGADQRIGKAFLFPGVGYGGSCFPKDVKALMRTGEEHGYDLKVIKAVNQVNTQQKTVIVEKVKKHFGNNLRDKTFAVWGLSFKPRTDDIREAPSLVILRALRAEGATIRAHDPVAMPIVQAALGSEIELCSNNYDALKGADALIVVTEWNEFRQPDFEKMKKMMKQPIVFDGRNIYDPKTMSERGFIYYSIGRGK
ncbi:MAG: UDP-glucose/GDP-mannose dehydrogenase family protein [Ignavibacteriae bacterium]|nr:UDP-glucose/GDP-mannose dehydrogenase family protein [Ignavibacteriota bacterium]